MFLHTKKGIAQLPTVIILSLIFLASGYFILGAMKDLYFTDQFAASVKSTTPKSPTNLAVSNPTANTLTLTWTDNSTNDGGFYIQRGLTSSSLSQIATVGSNTTTYIDSNLSPNTTYYYRIRAFNGNRQSQFSNTAQGTTLQGTTTATCTSFTYSDWSTCSNNTQTRTVTSSSPTGCTGGNPITTQSCTVSDITPPTVSLTSPSQGFTTSGTIFMSATATDDVGIAKVDFYVDNILKGTDSSVPFTFSLDTTPLTNTTHTFQAKATDPANNVGSSNSVTATVSNTVTTSNVYYVDSSRTTNGDGSITNPWKNTRSIDWTKIQTSLQSSNVTLYFSSRGTWTDDGYIQIRATGNSNYSLTLDGSSKYNTVTSGTPNWQTETGTSKASIVTSPGVSSGSIIIPNNNSSYITIKGFNVIGAAYNGVSIGESNPTLNVHHITVDNVTVDSPQNGTGIWFGFAEAGCHDLIVKNSLIKNTKTEGIYVGHYNYMGNGITGVIVENNTLIDTGLEGQGDIDLKPAAYGAIVRNNKVYRTALNLGGSVSGVVVASDNTKIYNNIFYNEQKDSSGDWGFGIYVTADGSYEYGGQGINSILIYNNLIYSNTSSGIKFGATTATPSANISGVKIYNNTIVGNNYGISVNAFGGRTITIQDMKNNILANNTLYDIYAGSGSALTISSSNNNDYYRTSGNSWYFGYEKTWAQWQALGFDLNGKNVNPNLDTNYKPTSASTALIDTGANLSSVFSDDLVGVARPQGSAWDIGAYEYVK